MAYGIRNNEACSEVSWPVFVTHDWLKTGAAGSECLSVGRIVMVAGKSQMTIGPEAFINRELSWLGLICEFLGS